MSPSKLPAVSLEAIALSHFSNRGRRGRRQLLRAIQTMHYMVEGRLSRCLSNEALVTALDVTAEVNGKAKSRCFGRVD